ncbi:putative metabolite transport protein YwtG [Rhodovastum atsumiense]|uniref:Sugar porter family MFS transporter n=1 Tax=Rhodovastum atsumiense TaxID=504468 RepID=A0A5M6ILD6_9PROT|nr:sugar porter family MFS transporter [Rhodovastum atsumiense]KAA5609080.1 sugar porter family MFS transporter [Rhodovastum atsumiense]CAH2602166.1 putative metabolite transport protein YwtG [Rhodovastum atsumiense]
MAPSLAPAAPRSWRAWLATSLGALGFLLFGYDTGVIAGALLFIRGEFALSPTLEGLVVSVLLCGAAIGGLVSGRLVERHGHRRLLMGTGILFTLGAAIAALAPSVGALVLARLVLGLAVGAASAQAMLYISETAPTEHRGAFAALAPLMCTTGILVSYLVGWCLAESGDWRMMFAVAIVPSLLLVAGMAFAPDSPRWLAHHGRIDAARAVLRGTLPEAEVEPELRRILTVTAAPAVSFTTMLREPVLRHALLLACGLALLQQVIGINTIVYYAPTIFRNLGFRPSDAILTTSFLQALAILSTIVAARIVDRAGRRPLLMAGAVAMAISLAAIGTVMSTPLAQTLAGHVAAVAAVALFKMAFSFSWGPLVWVTMPEVLPHRARGTGMGVATLTNWMANLVVSFSFPILLASGAMAVFGVFVGSCLLAFLFAAFVLPETARVSLEAIEQRSPSPAPSH